MNDTVPVEYGEVVGYACCIWPPPDRPFSGSTADVFDTVEEARELRNYFSRHGRRLEVVEVRRVLIE